MRIDMRTPITLAALIVVGIISAPSTPAQSAAAAMPKFEVVSVKPSTGCGDGGGAKGGRGGGAGGSSSPERLDLRCRTVMDLIQMAYVPRDTPRAQRLPGLLSCGVFAPSSTNDGSYVYGTTVAEFCVLLSFILDRDVIDKTGIAGVFDIHIEAPPTDGSPADVAPPADPGQRDPLPHASLTDPLGQAIFSAVQKVGLKLDPAKGPGDFLVIDRVERPSGN